MPVRMSAFLRHISIMHLLSLGYEHCDTRLWHLGRSLVTSLASGNPVRYLVPEPPSLRCLALSRRVRFTNRFTETVLDVRLRNPFNKRERPGPESPTFRDHPVHTPWGST